MRANEVNRSGDASLVDITLVGDAVEGDARSDEVKRVVASIRNERAIYNPPFDILKSYKNALTLFLETPWMTEPSGEELFKNEQDWMDSWS